MAPFSSGEALGFPVGTVGTMVGRSVGSSVFVGACVGILVGTGGEVTPVEGGTNALGGDATGLGGIVTGGLVA